MTDYKPLDLGPILRRCEERWPDEPTQDEALEEAAGECLDLLAEVVRLRREVAHGHIDCGAECWRGLRYDQLRDDACPTCQAAALDGWDPSKPLDWKPEEKA